jgi:hypothetical protein
MRSPAQSVSFNKPSVASDSQQYPENRSAIALVSNHFVEQVAHWRKGSGGRTRLSSEILAASAAAAHFCVVLMTAVVASSVYIELSNRSVDEEAGCYIWITLFAATVFVGGFERFGGY